MTLLILTSYKSVLGSKLQEVSTIIGMQFVQRVVAVSLWSHYILVMLKVIILSIDKKEWQLLKLL